METQEQISQLEEKCDELNKKLNRLSSSYQRNVQFAICLEKSIAAFWNASSYLTDEELEYIECIFDCIVDLINEMQPSDARDRLFDCIQKLGRSERKAFTIDLFGNMKGISPSPKFAYCRPPRHCYELDLNQM